MFEYFYFRQTDARRYRRSLTLYLHDAGVIVEIRPNLAEILCQKRGVHISNMRRLRATRAMLPSVSRTFMFITRRIFIRLQNCFHFWNPRDFLVPKDVCDYVERIVFTCDPRVDLERVFSH